MSTLYITANAWQNSACIPPAAELRGYWNGLRFTKFLSDIVEVIGGVNACIHVASAQNEGEYANFRQKIGYHSNVT